MPSREFFSSLLKIAERELYNAILALAHIEPVRILSLAVGTVQGVIETAALLQRQGVHTEMLLIDFDRSALQYALKLAEEHGVGDSITVREGDVLFFNRIIGNFYPDVIEMMGLIDYLRDKTAVMLLKKLRENLKPGGFFFTCHIHPNSESYVIRHTVNWSMIYRTRKQLKDLLTDSGFLGARLWTGPHGIHSVAVARKM